jgi:hypothetical protein
MVARLAGRSAPALSRYKIRRATESLRYDTTRARAELGWAPVTGVETLGGAPTAPRGAGVALAQAAGASSARLAQGGTS